MQSPEKCDQVLRHFVVHQGPKILVHCGGRDASGLSEKMGMQPHLIDEMEGPAEKLWTCLLLLVMHCKLTTIIAGNQGVSPC